MRVLEPVGSAAWLFAIATFVLRLHPNWLDLFTGGS